MNIARVKKRQVEIISTSGSHIRTFPSSNVVFADIKSDDKFVLVTYENGRVELTNSGGVLLRTITSTGAISARFSGDDLTVQYQSRKTEIRSESGVLERTL